MSNHVEANETVGAAKQLVSIGEVKEALDNGKMISKTGWIDRGVFIFKQVPSSVHISIVPKMTSLPESVKSEFKKRSKNVDENLELSVFSDIRYQDQIAMVHPDNHITSWSPSVSDIFAEDWIILD